MKVSVRFEGTGLQLRLLAENEVEQRMVGAVLNHQPENDSVRNHPVADSLVRAEVHYEGHHTNRKVDEVLLTVHRQEQPA